MELSKRKLLAYSMLSNRKHRQRSGLFIVEGEKSVADTICHYKPEAVIVEEGHALSMIENCKIDCSILLTATANDMQKLSSLSTAPSVIAVYHIPEKKDVLLEKLPEELYLMLDEVQDPGNLGTIIRTAHWFGIRRIFASKGTADIYNPKTIQSTMGSLPFVEVVYCDLRDVIENNREMPVYGLMLDGDNIYKTKLGSKGFVIMGNEGKGISRELRDCITHRLLIPPYDPDFHGESLNVAIATAVTLSTFRMESVK